MKQSKNNPVSTPVSRRQVLAATAGVGMAGLAGCVDGVLDQAGQSAAENAVSNRDAFPAALFGGDSRPDGTLIETDHTHQFVDIRVSGEYQGIESSVELLGHFINSLTKAENHNASRSDRMEEIRESDSNGENQKRPQALYGYLDGEATVCERFAITFPDARLGDGERALARHVTPPRLLRSTTGKTIGRAPQKDDGNIFQWESAVPHLSAEIKHPWPPLGTTGPFNPNEQLITAGGGDSGTGPSVVNIGALLDADRNSDGHNGVSVTDGEVSGFSWDDLESWGEETRHGAARITPMLLASVSAQPEDCPEPIPALLFVQRIRHERQCIFVGGWTINDNALYQDAVTMLVADAGPDVVPVRYDERGGDRDDSVRQTILEGLDNDRSRLGSMLYNEQLGEDREFNERALQFLPTGHREGPGRRRLTRQVWESAGGGDNRQSMNGTIVPLDPPIVHEEYPKAEEVDCYKRPPPKECWKTNLIPPVNNISSR